MKLTLLFLLPLFLIACGDRDSDCLHGHSHGLSINHFEKTECLGSQDRDERPGSWEWGGGMAWTKWEVQQHHHQHPATHDIELSLYGADPWTPLPAATALPAHAAIVPLPPNPCPTVEFDAEDQFLTLQPALEAKVLQAVRRSTAEIDPYVNIAAIEGNPYKFRYTPSLLIAKLAVQRRDAERSWYHGALTIHYRFSDRANLTNILLYDRGMVVIREYLDRGCDVVYAIFGQHYVPHGPPLLFEPLPPEPPNTPVPPPTSTPKPEPTPTTPPYNLPTFSPIISN